MRVWRRRIALMMTLFILAGCFGPAALADEGQLTVDERALELYEQSVKAKYEAFYQEAYHGFLMSDGVFLGAQIVRDIKADEAGSALTDWAAHFIGEELDKEQWMLYLIAQMSMQESGFSASAQSLAEYDSLKSLEDYTTDVIGMITGSIDLQNYSEKALSVISTLMGVASGLLDGTVNGIEDFRNIVALTQSYADHALFLNSVIERAETPALKEAAEFLLDSMDKAPALQADALRSLAVSAGYAVGSNVVVDGLIDYLKGLPELKDDPQLAKMVEGEANFIEGMKWFSLAQDLTLFGGDMILGTTDVFKRWSELVAISEMAEIMQAKAEAGMPGAEASAEEILVWAREYVPLMQAIALLRMRGEYCAMALIYEDAQAASLVSRWIGEYEEAIDFYNDRTQFLGECWEKLNDILVAPPAEAYRYDFSSYQDVLRADLDGDGLIDALGCSQDKYDASVNVITSGHDKFSCVHNAPYAEGSIYGADLGDGAMTMIISMWNGGYGSYLDLYRPGDCEYIHAEGLLEDQEFTGTVAGDGLQATVTTPLGETFTGNMSVGAKNLAGSTIKSDPIHYIEFVYVEETGCYDLVTWQALWPSELHSVTAATGCTQYRLVDGEFVIVKQWAEFF